MSTYTEGTFEYALEETARAVRARIKYQLQNEPEYYDDAAAAFEHGVGALYYVHRYYGRTTPLDIIDPDKITGLMLQKHYAYGRGALDVHGLQGILIRIDDKIGRFVSLIEQNWNPKDETLEDTIFDLYGYAILEIMYRDEMDLLPYEGELVENRMLDVIPPMVKLEALAKRANTPPF